MLQSYRGIWNTFDQFSSAAPLLIAGKELRKSCGMHKHLSVLKFVPLQALPSHMTCIVEVAE